MLPTRSTVTDTLSFLRETCQSFCDGDDAPGEFHPTGRYRIEAILRNTPEIHDRFRCPVEAEPPPSACTFAGNVPLTNHPSP